MFSSAMHVLFTCADVVPLFSSLVHPLNKLSYAKLDSKAVGIKEGVVFLTYSSLIASTERGRSRLNQLVQWFGELDGLIVFDEVGWSKAKRHHFDFYWLVII